LGKTRCGRQSDNARNRLARTGFVFADHAVHDIEFDPKGAATTRSRIFMPKRPSPLPPEEPAEPQPGPDLPPVQEPPPEEPDVEPVKPVQDPLRDPVQRPPRMIISAN